jgi:glycerophosphoryl diester phosphodiesterase
MIISVPHPLDHLLSHRLRGFSPHESSLSGLKAALASPARYLEIDTRVTADGEILVLHDARLDRLTQASGPVRQWRTASAGPPLFKGPPSEPLARFEELVRMFAAAPNGQTLMVDIKDYGAEQEHYRILERYGILERVEIVSWLPEVLLRWHEIDPERPLSFSHIALTRWPGLLRAVCTLLGSGALLRWLGRRMPAGSALAQLRNVILRMNDENRPLDLAQLQGTFPIHLLDRLPGGRVGQALLASRGSVGIPASFATARYVREAHAAGLRVFIFSLDRAAEVRKCLTTASPDVIFTNNAGLFREAWPVAPPARAAQGATR